MSPYLYEPLGEGQIRLLTLIPAKESRDELLVRLCNVPFDLATETVRPDYEALSYVWGSEENKVNVYILQHAFKNVADSQLRPRDVQVIGVTRNLDSALRHLRLANKARTLWIDAICIDQSNTEEKGKQVASMGNIFLHSHRVVFWLGEASNGSTKAMDAIGSLGNRVIVSTKTYPEMDITAKVPSDDIISSLHGLTEQYPLSELEMEYIDHLLRRPWFERLWIRQELAMAGTQSVVQCGIRSVPWTCFWDGIAAFWFVPHCRHQYPTSSLWVRLGELEGLFSQVRIQRYAQTPTWLMTPVHGIRIMFGRSVCKDPRDRLYAITSLLEPCRNGQVVVTPDYTKSPMQVFQDFVTELIKSPSADYDFLAECQLCVDPEKPTWVPDWRKQSQTVLAIHMNATGSLTLVPQLPSPGVLRVAGIPVTTIKDVRAVGNLSAQFHSTWSFVREVVADDAQGGRIHGRSMWEAYATAMIGGQFSNCELPLDESAPRQSDIEEIKRITLEVGDSCVPQEGVFLAFFTYCALALRGRQIFTDGQGRVGLVPANARPLDLVCVILGCRNLMVLRMQPDGSFMVVGDAFTDGFCHGEALLGDLPQGLRPVFHHDMSRDSRTGSRLELLNEVTGEIVAEDPRFSKVPIEPAAVQSFYHLRETTPSPYIRFHDIKDVKKLNKQARHFDLV